MNLGFYTLIIINIILIVTAILLLIFGYYAEKQPKKVLRKIFTLILIVLSVFSLLTYVEFGKVHPLTMRIWDFYHYHMGSKYFKELGYTNLYNATLTADHEMDDYFDDVKIIRNLENYKMIERREVLANSELYKSTFSPERWESFKKDLKALQPKAKKSTWIKILQDKGYNASPFWTFFGRTLTNLFSADNETAIYLITKIDYLFIIMLFSLIYFGFGLRAMLLSIIILGLNPMARFVNLGGSIMRLDWLLAFGAGIYFLKKQKYTIAGVLTAISAMIRVFPAVFVLILGMKAIIELIKKKTIPRHYGKFFIGFTVGIIVMIGIGASYGQGIKNWVDFKQKMVLHNDNFAQRRIGFRYVFASLPAININDVIHNGSKKINVAKMTKSFRQLSLIPIKDTGNAITYSFLVLLFISIFIYTVKNRPDHEAYALSIIAAFFLVSPTDYYYVMLLLLTTVFFDLKKKGHLIGLISLFFLFLFIRLADYYRLVKLLEATMLFSHMMFFYFFYAMGYCLREGRSEQPLNSWHKGLSPPKKEKI